jgi:hypothetical protein
MAGFALTLEVPRGALIGSLGMSNVLSDEKKQQVIALGKLGWSLRRFAVWLDTQMRELGDKERRMAWKAALASKALHGPNRPT